MIVVNNQGPSSFPASGGNTVLMVVYVNTPWAEVCAATTSDSWISVVPGTHQTVRMDTYCYYLVTISPNAGAYRVGSVVFRSEGSSLAVTMLKQGSDLYVEKSIGDPVFYDVTGRTDFEYGVMCDGVQVLDALAKRAPDATAITLDISSIARDYLRQDMVDLRNVTATMVYNNDALRTVSVTDEYGADIERWKFLYEYLGEWTGQTRYDMTEPINGRVSPMMKMFFTQYNEISYSVSPTSLDFEASGSSAQFTVNMLDDVNWRVFSYPEWVTLSATGGSIGQTTITVTSDANQTPYGRSGLIGLQYHNNLGWETLEYITIEQAPEEDKNIPLTFNVSGAGTLTFTHNRTLVGDVGNLTIQYRINDGEWTSLTSSTAGTSFNVSQGDVVAVKGDNSRYGSLPLSYNTFSGSTAEFELYGNAMSLIDSTNYKTVENITEQYCFNRLFAGCTGLTTAEHMALTTTTLPMHCYTSMFQGCTSLTTAPLLPALTLNNSSYNEMFRDCSSLNNIRCLATSVSAVSCTLNWVNGVAAEGTFVKNASMVSWDSGNSGIPNNWTIIDA